MTGSEIETVREKIDEIDVQIYNLLMNRAELVAAVRQCKGGEGYAGNPMRPAREAIILRRLLQFERKELPVGMVVHLWRELLSGFCLMQGEFSVAYFPGDEGDALRDLIRSYFGAVTPITRCSGIAGILQTVANSKGVIGVLPAPQEFPEGETLWWLSVSESSFCKVIGRAPFVLGDGSVNVKNDYYLIADIEPEPSGDDVSVFVITTRQDVSRTTALELLQQHGKVGRTLAVFDNERSGVRRHLTEVDGFIDKAETEALVTSLIENTGEKILTVVNIGCYPRPYDLKETND